MNKNNINKLIKLVHKFNSKNELNNKMRTGKYNMLAEQK